MTDNKETPENGASSKNTPNSNFDELIHHINNAIQIESTTALNYHDSAHSFFQRNLRNPLQGQKYIQEILAYLQNISHIENINITDEEIQNIIKKTRNEFLKKLFVFENQRLSITQNIETEYDLTPEQIDAVQEQIDNIPSNELNQYQLASRRHQLVVQMSQIQNEILPLKRSISLRLKNLFGANLNSEVLTAIEQGERSGKMKFSTIQAIWGQLDTSGKNRLLSLISISVSLQQLYEIDGVLFSKDILRNYFQENIKANISPKLSAILNVSESVNIDQILSELEWSDISQISVSENTISDMMYDKNAPLPKQLVRYFQEWFEEQADIQLQAESKKEPTALLEDHETMMSKTSFVDGIRKLQKKSLEKNKEFHLSGDDLLENFDFLKNTEPLIFHFTSNGITSTYLLETDQKLEDTSSMYGGWFITQFNPLGHATFKEYVTINFFVNLFEISSSINFEKSSTFFKRNPHYTIQDNFSVEDLDRTQMVPPIDNSNTEDGRVEADTVIEEEDEEITEVGIEETTLADNLEQAEVVNSLASTQEDTPNSIESISIFPQTLEAFNAAISKKLGQSIALSVGDSISIGKVGSNKYNVYKIQSFTENGIILWNGSSAFPPEEISFSNLYEHGVENETSFFKILENKLNSAEDFLSIMQSNSTQSEIWKDLETIRDDGDTYFDFIDRRFDKIKNKKQYFPGNEGHILEIISIHDGMAQVRFGEKFKQAKDPSGEMQNTAEWSSVQDIPLQYLTQYMNRFSCAPWNNPPREIPSRAIPSDIQTTKGTVKAAFGRLSIHDLISGSKKFMDELKHHLQHGNHLQEQRVMLGIAKKIGLDSWNSEWYADFKSQYENGEKKLIEERLEKLGKMGTPDRHKSIRASLLNNGTHDYDHWTNALAMIEKHGNLYAGGLQDLEGSWIFFKRIAGIPLDKRVNDYPEFQKVVSIIRGKGIDNITEEAVIEEYMKTNPHFPNSQIWRMVKTRVRDGTEGEYTNGGKETEEFINLEQRLSYAMGKLRSKEYAHGIGAMEKVFEKEGSAHKKQSIAFMLAMSRIPERLPRRLLDKFIPLFDQGQVHSPALAFIKDRKSQEKFRKAVRSIVDIQSKKLIADGNLVNGSQMQADFDKMMEAIGENTDKMVDSPHGAPLDFDQKMFKSVDNFWKRYGKEIQYELTANPQGSIMISESQIKEHPALADYKKILQTQLGDTNVMKEPGGASFMDGEAGAGVISLKPDKIIDKMGLQTHYGGFSGENLERAIQTDFRISMEVIRDKKDMSEDDKKAWFKNVYIQYVKKITATSNLKSFLLHPTVQPFNRLGLIPPAQKIEEQIAKKTEELKQGIRDTQLVMAQSKNTLQRLQKNTKGNGILGSREDTEITRLNQEIIDYTGKINELQVHLRETENTRGQYVSFDENNPEHQQHFDKQFLVFMGREKPSIVIENTSASVSKILDKSMASDIYGAGESGASVPGFTGETHTEETF